MEGKLVFNGNEKAVDEKALFWIRLLLLLHIRNKGTAELAADLERDFRLHAIWTPWKKFDFFELTKKHPDTPVAELMGEVAPLDLDLLVRSLGSQECMTVVEACLNQLKQVHFDELEELFRSEFGSKFTAEDRQSAVFVNRVSLEAIRGLTVLIQSALESGSLFDQRDLDPESLIGSWRSIRETGELRINYNQTDLMPLGKTVFLTIEPYEGDYYLFVCSMNAVNYSSREEGLLEVYRSLVSVEGPYLNHFNFWSREWFAKAPASCTGNLFSTQIEGSEFDFQRTDTSCSGV